MKVTLLFKVKQASTFKVSIPTVAWFFCSLLFNPSNGSDQICLVMSSENITTLNSSAIPFLCRGTANNFNNYQRKQFRRWKQCGGRDGDNLGSNPNPDWEEKVWKEAKKEGFETSR